ncbi:MAG: ABC transporter ATP-binding protein [Oscillospiraceae bacterium]|jgi:ABC-2 type transport system ATP-binding protein|nr:ABC transporter ATP-binding protein [Oscillospiraceae bacterium]
MIEIQGLTKRYGSKYAIKDVTFSIRKGEILGFLGRNGAGKTTTMNIVTGYISASGGRALLDGHDVLEEPRLVKRRIGYLPEQPPLYMDMTVDEYLRFACAIKEVKPSAVKAHLDDVRELVKINDVRKRLIKNLSKGYKQRVGLAQALVGNPEMIILDEPTVGLDPRQILEIRSLIKRLGQDHTVVLSSHILTEVADVCERVVIINNGVIVAQDTLSRLTSGVGDAFRITLRVAGHEGEIKRALRSLEGVKFVDSLAVKEEGSYDFVVETDRSCDIRKQLFYALAKAGLPIMALRTADITLEDIFLKLTGDNEGA